MVTGFIWQMRKGFIVVSTAQRYRQAISNSKSLPVFYCRNSNCHCSSSQIHETNLLLCTIGWRGGGGTEIRVRSWWTGNGKEVSAGAEAGNENSLTDP
jgi:hypothetical protein